MISEMHIFYKMRSIQYTTGEKKLDRYFLLLRGWLLSLPLFHPFQNKCARLVSPSQLLWQLLSATHIQSPADDDGLNTKWFMTKSKRISDDLWPFKDL